MSIELPTLDSVVVERVIEYFYRFDYDDDQKLVRMHRSVKTSHFPSMPGWLVSAKRTISLAYGDWPKRKFSTAFDRCWDKGGPWRAFTESV